MFGGLRAAFSAKSTLKVLYISNLSRSEQRNRWMRAVMYLTDVGDLGSSLSGGKVEGDWLGVNMVPDEVMYRCVQEYPIGVWGGWS